MSEWIKYAKVGDKVQCIWADWRIDQYQAALTYGIDLPQKNEIYTVRSIDETILGGLGIRLMELVNPIVCYEDVGDAEQRFSPLCFRPVPDISIFTDMLNAAPAPVEETA